MLICVERSWKGDSLWVGLDCIGQGLCSGCVLVELVCEFLLESAYRAQVRCGEGTEVV